MSKKLDAAQLQDELAGSAFFAEATKPAPAPSPAPSVSPPEAATEAREIEGAGTPPHRSRGTSALPATPRPAAKHTPKAIDPLAAAVDPGIETLRKAVKAVGREDSYFRLTGEEKQQLLEIVHTYRLQGVKTSVNEIGRIAINYLLADYDRKAQASILARVIAALLA